MRTHSAILFTAAVSPGAAGAFAQSPAREQLARGQALLDQRLAMSARAMSWRPASEMTVSKNVPPLYGNRRMLTVQRARSDQIGVAFQ